MGYNMKTGAHKLIKAHLLFTTATYVLALQVCGPINMTESAYTQLLKQAAT